MLAHRLQGSNVDANFSLLRFAPLAALGAALALAPVLGSDDGPVLCFSRRHTDVACPGCGLTRGVFDLFAMLTIWVVRYNTETLRLA